MRIRHERAARDSEALLERRVDAVAAESGLRVLREVGDGGTACVCLVVPLDADPFSPLDASRSALKIGRFDSESVQRVREDRVLASVRSPHVVALLGTRGGGEPCLLLEYLPGGTLAELLARREFLRLGEAVTILVSVVRALSAIHAAGFWHGSLAASKVMFAGDGRPVIVGLSHAIPVGGESGSSGSRPAPDADGFREIVDLLARAVGDEAVVTAVGELTALARAGLPCSMNVSGWQQLEGQVFRLGHPEPVLLAPLSASLIHHAGRASEGVVSDVRGRSRGIASEHRRWLGRERVAAIVRALREKRKLVAYSVGCLVAGVVAITIVLAPPDDKGGRAESAAGDTAPVSSEGAKAPSSSISPTAATVPPAGDSRPASTRPTQEDDPVDAAVELLRARLECFSGVPVDARCLDALLQPGSAIDGSDRADLQQGAAHTPAGERDFRSYEVSLIERMGDAALLALTPPAAPADVDRGHAHAKPASLLMVRGEAGWRLRELFEN